MRDRKGGGGFGVEPSFHAASPPRCACVCLYCKHAASPPRCVCVCLYCRHATAAPRPNEKDKKNLTIVKLILQSICVPNHTKVYVKYNIFHKKSQYMIFHVLLLQDGWQWLLNYANPRKRANEELIDKALQFSNYS